MKSKKSSFRNKVSGNSANQGQNNNFGYINMPAGVEMYTPTPGSREKFDIIPYYITDPKHPDLDDKLDIKVGDLWYRRPFKIHRNVGAENDTVICPTTFGKPCPICEYKKKRKGEGAEKEELEAYHTSNRNLYIVIPKDIKKLEEVPHIFDCSQHLFQKLLNEELKENSDNEIFPDLEEGLTLKVRWVERSFMNNKFAEANKIDFIAREESYDESILEELPELDNLLKCLTYSQLEAKFYGEDVPGNSESDDNEKEDKPAKRTFTKPKTTEKKVKEEDDDEDEKPVKNSKITWDDLQDMEETEIAEIIESKSLEIDTEDYSDLDELRSAVADELGIQKPKEKPTSKPVSKKPEPAKKPEPPSASSGKCPHGHKFGVDTDKKPECDDCTVWGKCIDKKEGK